MLLIFGLWAKYISNNRQYTANIMVKTNILKKVTKKDNEGGCG